MDEKCEVENNEVPKKCGSCKTFSLDIKYQENSDMHSVFSFHSEGVV